MSRKPRQFTSGCAAIALLLAACGGTEDGAGVAGGDEAEADLSDLDDLEAEGEPDKTAEEVYAEIAAMDLSYEERLAYLEEKALEEGAVLTYGSSNLELQEPWSEGFQEAYPDINHLYVRQRSDDLHQRIMAEARADRNLVDVINANAVIGANLHAEGLIADHHGIPVPEGYPELYVEDWAVAGYISPNTPTWNTNAYPDPDEAPKEPDDFLKPEHSGCIIDVGAQNWTAGLILDRGFEAAEEWFEAFIENGGQVRRGHSQNAALMAAGEFDCAVYLYVYSVEELISDGAPMEWAVPDPTPANATSNYIYKHTTRPHAAALFMHWMLDVDGSQIVADTGRVAVHPDVKMPDYQARLEPFLEPGSEYQERLLPLLSEVAAQVDEEALYLLDTYLVPNLVDD